MDRSGIMRRFVYSLAVVAVLGASTAAQSGVAQQAVAARDLCSGHRGPGIHCGPGNGRRTRGGGNKVSHLGWPAVTGILWIVRPSTHGKRDGGTELNDELLGSHGSDLISGGFGRDILWGDQLPTGNNAWQHDVVDGGPGNDWIYSSHGRNDIQGGAGNDHIWGHFGRGTIDCGSGWDVVHTKHHSTYRLRNCERHLDH
jgi:Ca2+-binding RTX toxin-like protein